MPNGTQSRGSAALLVACLSAGMALTLAAGLRLMTHHPADVHPSAPAADATLAGTDGPSTAPTVKIRRAHAGPAVTTAFPHTTERPTPRRKAVRPRRVHAVVQSPQPVPHRVHRVAVLNRAHHVQPVRRAHRVLVVHRRVRPSSSGPASSPPPSREICHLWHGAGSGHHHGHGGGGWQHSRDACRPH